MAVVLSSGDASLKATVSGDVREERERARALFKKSVDLERLFRGECAKNTRFSNKRACEIQRINFLFVSV